MIDLETKESLLLHAKKLENKRFKDIGSPDAWKKYGFKARVGHLIEEEHFGYAINSVQGPDFEDLNIELKTTPVKKNKNNTYSAKERLVLNIINYESEVSKTFESSSFWTKNQNLLILFYLHDDTIPFEMRKILRALLYDYPKKDLIIIKNDWKIITDKIKSGKAHEISEGDTMYLGACTKGATSKSVRSQPFSSIMAKQRAFSLKQSYMTQLVRKKNITSEAVKADDILYNSDFETALYHKLKPYFGMTQSTLKTMYKVESTAKNLNEILVAKMLGIDGKVSKSEEFMKANIVPKTIRVNADESINEHMSFKTFKYTDIIKEDWDESELRNMFESTKYLFIVFQFNNHNDLVFKGIKLWNMPVNVLDNEVKSVWMKTKTLIESGTIVKSVSPKGVRQTYFPKATENPVSHVRPHAKNALDTYPLPTKEVLTDAQDYTKHCFWLNKEYIYSIIQKVLSKARKEDNL